MRHLFLIAITLVASTSALVEVQSVLGYHERIGIPEAARIKAFEDKILAEQQKETRIVGGILATTNQFPYLGGLIIDLENVVGNSVCGSSLVTSNRLVTAAHCWHDGNFQAWQFTVVLGSNVLFSGGTRIPTSQVVMHPQWDPPTHANDIAVVYLPLSVFFSLSIQPIALPSGTQLEETFVGDWTIAAGYGKTSDQQAGVPASTVISHVNLQVITVAECQSIFGTVVQSSNICTSGTGGVGICSGDSGGPLVVNRNGQNVLVGVSSFVSLAGCQLGLPSGFARVTSFYSFINQHL